MHALLVKVRTEVNAFLFHVKSKHTVSSFGCKYHIISGLLRLAKLQNTSTLTCACVAYLDNEKVPDVLCLFV